MEKIMFICNRHLDGCDPATLLALEGYVERYEAARRDGRRPSLTDFLPASEDGRRAVLLELVHTDLEYRLKEDNAARVEEYLREYPELHEEDAAVIELIEAEYRLRQRRGDAPKLADYLARFPERAATLAQRLSAITVLSSGSAPRRLGKFELLEAAGSGAFSTVYRARDADLGRIVAVKVARGISAEPEERDRFLREAQSAASLRHPGIVTVHEVGQSEGLCYLVSEWIAGPTLAQRLAVDRPDFRTTAEIIASVAEALQYTHEQGVIHRDIKPSNILLDAAGRPLVADFGLARRTADSTLTVDGQVLGTPAYMPPEQARGEGRHADARSDIYSLGAVLYECLTGVLPFRGHGTLIVRRILEEEPLAPRRLDDGIPRDLETICRKAMCKEPAGRYPTAAHLAEELRRFLRGEPIRTRSPGPAGRLVRWCRRKPVVAGLLAALLLVTLVGFAGVTLAWRDAEGNLAEARHQKEEAERNYRDAHQAISEFAKLGSHPLMAHTPDVNPVRAELAATALKYYETFLERRADDPSLRLDVAESYLHLAHLYTPEKSPKAVAAYRKALPLWQELARGQPEELKFRRSLADTCFQLGNICFGNGQDDEAVPLLNQACDLLPALIAAEPNNVGFLMDMAHSHRFLGSLLSDAAHTEAAERYYQQTHDLLVELRRAEPNSRIYADQFADVCHLLGIMKCDRWEGAAGERCFEKERTLLTKLAKDSPGDISLQMRFAENLYHIARAQDRSQRPAAALESYRADALLWEDLVSKRPSDEACLGPLAACYHVVGNLEKQSGRPEEAVRMYRRSLVSRQTLCRLNPDSPIHRGNLSGTWYRLAEALETLKHYPEAESAYRQALLHEQTLFARRPGDAKVGSRLRDRYEALARVCQVRGLKAEAEKALSESKKMLPAPDMLRATGPH